MTATATTALLDAPPRRVFVRWLNDCAEYVDPWWLRAEAERSIAYRRAQTKESASARLEQRWYASLANDEPDYSVYADTAYLPDLWSCWVVFSRTYLRGIRAPKSLPERGGVLASLGDVRSVCDLGCGFGYSTAALTELFPDADVHGTNLDGITQTAIANRVAERYGFDVRSTPADVGPVDLAFASEYFEHFAQPIDHLNEVLDALEPRALLYANTFGSRSTGHFPSYQNGLDGRATSRAFAATLRDRGYRKIETQLWNNRPTYWERAE